MWNADAGGGSSISNGDTRADACGGPTGANTNCAVMTRLRWRCFRTSPRSCGPKDIEFGAAGTYPAAGRS
jgi:hypothetical protein